MPCVSRAADHLLLWWVLAALMTASGKPRMRRASRRGIAAMLAAGTVCNLLSKQLVGRDRPPRHIHQRRPGRVPDSGSFPSGHTCAAAAFTTAVWQQAGAGAGAVAAALTGAVAFSRLYTGAHYPADVLAGTGAGIATALLLNAGK